MTHIMDLPLEILDLIMGFVGTYHERSFSKERGWWIQSTRHEAQVLLAALRLVNRKLFWSATRELFREVEVACFYPYNPTIRLNWLMELTDHRAKYVGYVRNLEIGVYLDSGFKTTRSSIRKIKKYCKGVHSWVVRSLGGLLNLRYLVFNVICDREVSIATRREFLMIIREIFRHKLPALKKLSVELDVELDFYQLYSDGEVNEVSSPTAAKTLPRLRNLEIFVHDETWNLLPLGPLDLHHPHQEFVKDISRVVQEAQGLEFLHLHKMNLSSLACPSRISLKDLQLQHMSISQQKLFEIFRASSAHLTRVDLHHVKFDFNTWKEILLEMVSSLPKLIEFQRSVDWSGPDIGMPLDIVIPHPNAPDLSLRYEAARARLILEHGIQSRRRALGLPAKRESCLEMELLCLEVLWKSLESKYTSGSES